MADDRKKKPAPAGAKPAAKARAKPAPKPAAGKATRRPAAKPAARAAKAAAPRKAAAAKAPAAKRPAKSRTVKTSARAGGATAPVGEGPPGAEGYFVARVRGEDAAREAPHPLTETATDALPPEQATLPEEDLGELPWGYGDDTFMALPRDPRTLFLFWDFSVETTRRAFAGLPGGRAELRIHARVGAGWEEVRRVEFALEARGFYVHDLEPGRVYRAEVHALGKGGEDRTVGQPTNDMMLPPLGPSPVIDDRFIRIPWDMPLGRLLGPGHAGSPFSDEARSLLARLSDWSRFGTGGGSAGGIGGAQGAWGPGLGSGSGSGFGGGSGAGRGP